MSFPQIQKYPTKTVTLPLTGKKVTYRPFTAREEFLLLMAKESSTFTEVIDHVMKVIQACCPETVDVKSLPIPELELLFLKIRCLSKGETAEPIYRCRKPNESGEVCNTAVKFTIDLDKVEIKIPEGHSTTVQIRDTDYFIKFKYLSAEQMEKTVQSRKDTSISTAADALYASVEALIHSDGTVYNDFEFADAKDLIDSLRSDQLDDVKKTFVDSMPALREVLNFSCPRCGHKEKIVLEGLEAFFS